MKLRSYLLIANGISIAVILIFLIVSYVKMVLSLDVVIWLSGVTLGVGLLSFILHFFLTRPIETSIHRITLESKKIADGDFQGQLVPSGPIEFQMLAKQFNEMSRKLDESFNKLRTSESSRRELVENISHDLRTPLASIQSFVEAIQDDVIKDDETFQRYLSTIRLETRKLSGLINDLFQLSRLQSGVELFEPEPCHVDNIILEIIQSHLLQLEDKKIEIKVEMPDSLPRVAIMPAKLKRALSNLLQNAIRYSPEGGLISISVSEFGNHMVKVSVADQGEGIRESEQELIFERLYRTDKSRNRESGGAGLGLAIAKSIIDLHGGTIRVESVYGKGSCFWFTVPQYVVK